MKKAYLSRRIFPLRNEKGAVLVVGLFIILVLAILSVAAMMSTGTELTIASNDRSTKEAFYVAEAGSEEGRARLQATSPSPISDTQPNNVNWYAFIGTEAKSQGKGWQQSNSNHVRVVSLYPALNYVVTITHKVVGGNIQRWGDSNNDGRPEENTTTGENIYVIISEGTTPIGAVKSVRAECAKVAQITAPAALYTEALTTIQGTSTNVLGIDGVGCGGNSVPGIITRSTVNQNGGPTITGSPQAIYENSPMNIDVQYMVNQFKRIANYDLNWSGTYSGVHWGTPTPGANQQSPSSCSEHNIVHINTSSSVIQLTGESSGCGILLVEGDLAVHGGFQWYGVIMVTGSLTFSGGGGKNVTGAVLVGGEVSADLVGGDANIVYCSSAIRNQTDELPLVTLRWVEMFS